MGTKKKNSSKGGIILLIFAWAVIGSVISGVFFYILGRGNCPCVVEEVEGYSEEAVPFSREALVEALLEFGVEYPHIAMAQSIVETGHFKSVIFNENNNLFGMKLARRRETVATGENRGHAVYEHWRESVRDYKLWQEYVKSVKPKHFKSEEAYFRYLSAVYAKNKRYVKVVKRVIKREGLTAIST